ncbi:hypothetical protein ASPACDRAFT_111291 [Aspergillus aculeatus ATCC 16872]|uniref:FAD-dependent oxidoreductase 2 FAD binding domain-containing protein n=1 Tax=Aspergillus aculeatus (strain ATCC 16872 / CBS 172.66 / WB 5094) TaxID=690307 RepID=A0A1L9X4Y0_ASPA1|nr:uncharacterized protein ASPACDRAFT_111291 [Aspergillus aculeatus ATCC 16872]OJK03505.1 hypothetical protein ASPACDRAFT_111291 [Aspergillus aculeatus ATCC 16872]
MAWARFTLPRSRRWIVLSCFLTGLDLDLIEFRVLSQGWIDQRLPDECDQNSIVAKCGFHTVGTFAAGEIAG